MYKKIKLNRKLNGTPQILQNPAASVFVLSKFQRVGNFFPRNGQSLGWVRKSQAAFAHCGGAHAGTQR